MKSIIKKILLMYFIFVIIKIIMAYFVKTETIFADSYIYMKGAESLWLLKSYAVHGLPIFKYPPLYSLIISISYLFKDMSAVYLAMKIINSFISSLIIIPAYLISKEFLSKRKSLLIAVLVGILSNNLIISNYIMSENLFYPLFLFEVYFLYKFFSTNKLGWSILAGLFLGLCYLTRTISLVIIISIIFIGLILIYKNKQKYLLIKRLSILFIIFILTILPWLIRNYFLFGSFQIISGYSNNIETFGFAVKTGISTLGLTLFNLILITIFSFLHWFIVHLGIIFLSLLVIFPLFYFYLIKNYKNLENNLKTFCLISGVLVVSTFLLTVIYSALEYIAYNNTLIWWLVGMPNTRYLEFIFPLILILGFVYKDKYNLLINRKYIFITSILLVLSFQLIFFSRYLFPIMNTPLSYLGLLGSIINLVIKPFNYILFIFILGIIPFGFYFLYNKLSFKKFIYIFIIFLLINSSIGYAAIVYNSNTWYNSEQIKLSLWLKDELNKEDVIIIDIRDNSTILDKINQNKLYIGYPNNLYHSATIIGYWINNPLFIENIEKTDKKGYIITMHKLEKKLVKTVKVNNEEIYVYSN